MWNDFLGFIDGKIGSFLTSACKTFTALITLSLLSLATSSADGFDLGGIGLEGGVTVVTEVLVRGGLGEEGGNARRIFLRAFSLAFEPPELLMTLSDLH